MSIHFDSFSSARGKIQNTDLTRAFCLVAQERGYQHLSYLARRNPYKPFKLDQTVGEAITCLARKRCHRLPVVNDQGELIYILSQTSVIQFLNRCAFKLGGVGQLHGSNTQQAYGDVFSIFLSRAKIDLFIQMSSHILSGCPNVTATWILSAGGLPTKPLRSCKLVHIPVSLLW